MILKQSNEDNNKLNNSNKNSWINWIKKINKSLNNISPKIKNKENLINKPSNKLAIKPVSLWLLCSLPSSLLYLPFLYSMEYNQIMSKTQF